MREAVVSYVKWAIGRFPYKEPILDNVMAGNRIITSPSFRVRDISSWISGTFICGPASTFSVTIAT